MLTYAIGSQASRAATVDAGVGQITVADAGTVAWGDPNYLIAWGDPNHLMATGDDGEPDGGWLIVCANGHAAKAIERDGHLFVTCRERRP